MRRKTKRLLLSSVAHSPLSKAMNYKPLYYSLQGRSWGINELKLNNHLSGFFRIFFLKFFCVFKVLTLLMRLCLCAIAISSAVRCYFAFLRQCAGLEANTFQLQLVVFNFWRKMKANFFDINYWPGTKRVGRDNVSRCRIERLNTQLCNRINLSVF